jgi:quercetin dioxygenase-like cupin family protein
MSGVERYLTREEGNTHGNSTIRLGGLAPRAGRLFHRRGLAGSDCRDAGARNVRASLVHFEPGARTAWHTHPAGQTLYILSGVGRVQSVGGPIREVRAGDVVWFAPNEKHWHGAGPQTTMAHVAITEVRDGKFVEWLEKVTDQQYQAAAG